VTIDPDKHGPMAAISFAIRVSSPRCFGVGSTPRSLPAIHPGGSFICHSISTVASPLPGPSSEAEAAIKAWRGECSPVAAAFAKSVVRASVPPGAARARTLLWCCARLAGWGERVGLETRREVLLHPSTLERYIVSGLSGLSPATRRTMRSNLRSVARASVPALWGPCPGPLRRDALKQPYTDAQVTAYFELVAHQATPERIARLNGLLCLGLGAGLDAPDMRLVCGDDVIERSGGVVVVVRGAKARVVPVLERHRRALWRSATVAGEGFIVGGDDPSRKNVTSPLLSTLEVGRLDRLEVGRLRATWLAFHAQNLGLVALVHAAGLTSSSRLIELAAAQPLGDEAAMVSLLGGSP